MHLFVSQASGLPFYRQIKDQIAEMIRAGALLPGTPLPSVRQLAADLLVSVITVKKAYDELEAAGLVASHQGRGTFVADTARAASRDQLVKDTAAELDAVVRRAAGVDLTRAELTDAFERALRAHYPSEST